MYGPYIIPYIIHYSIHYSIYSVYYSTYDVQITPIHGPRNSCREASLARGEDTASFVVLDDQAMDEEILRVACDEGRVVSDHGSTP